MRSSDSPVYFGEWVKRRRKTLDLTQEELARKTGCSVFALRKIETGERRPSKQLAELLAKSLEIPADEEQTFIKAARGDLNIERLRAPSLPLPAAPSPLAAQASPSNKIPLPPTPLIGRDTELANMERIFKDPSCRLLTLTGVGGIGKTRLAVEFAARMCSTLPGGVFYIPLTSVSSSGKIVLAIADVLDFRFSGPMDPKDQLFNYMEGSIQQDALFVFDNLEHLLSESSTSNEKPGVVVLVSEILIQLPHLKILGTSRERLNLHGEWTYELHGLTVPPSNYSGPLAAYDSIALFLKSAQRVRADFEVSEEERASLIQICRLVEGVPLALELAAAWVSLLSCREIAQEIQTNMDFLTTSMRDFPERHRSIRAAFDHSWKLLSDEERAALCQLSVFQGGFDRQAALQVAGASLSSLASLSAKSLVRRTESGRYDLHEVIRQYALAHLKENPSHIKTYERHCDHYLAFVQDREKALKSARQQEAVRQLADEIDNIRAAWEWAIQQRKFAQLGEAGRAFGWYFEIAGLYREGILQLEHLLQALKARPQDRPYSRLVGLALVHQAILHLRIGEFDQAQRLYEAAIHILRSAGDPALSADALIFLGIIQHLKGDFVRSRALAEEGLVLAQAAKDQWLEALAILNLGMVASLTGRYGEAYEQMMPALAQWRTLGDPHAIAMGMNFMVPTLSKLGRYEEAKAFMQESITLCEQAKNRWGMGTAYRFLGLANIAAGEYAQAQTNLLKSLEIFGENFTGWDIACSLDYLGHAQYLAGELDQARDSYLEALRIAVNGGSFTIALDALLGLGQLQAQAGETERALLLCYFILDHSSSEEDTKSRAQELRAALEPTINWARVKDLQQAARAATLGALVEEVLAAA